MKDIKTKKINKTPRTLEKAARIPRNILRQSLASAEDRTRNMEKEDKYGESPQSFASDSVEQVEKDTVQRGKDTFQGATDRAVDHFRKKRLKTKKTAKADGQPASPDAAPSNKNAQAGSKALTQNRAVKNARRSRDAVRPHGGAARQAGGTGKAASKTAATTQKTVRGAKAAKRTIKTTQRSVKAAKRAVKTGGKAIKTAAHAARAARMTAQAAVRAAQMAKMAAKAAIAAAKLAVRILIATIKAIIAAIKALIMALAAGGWIVVLVIIIIAVIAFVVGSVFGVFFSDEESTNQYTISEIVQEKNKEFEEKIQTEIDALSAQDTYDEVKVNYDGDGDASVSNWADIIGVYAARAMDDEMEPITVNQEHRDMLEDTFEVMIKFTISHEVQTEDIPVQTDPQTSPTPKPTPGATTGPRPSETEPPVEVKKTLIINVSIASMDYKQGADHYNFNDDQREMLEEMMSPAYYSLFAELLGVDLYGDSDLPTIIGNLPPGERGSAIAEAALKYVGMPYSQEAGKRGVTHVDCSLLVKWAYRDAGVDIPDVSVEQARYCKENNKLVSRDQLQPGDIVFWTKTTCHCGRLDEIHHVGIYLGDNQVCEASFGKGRVVVGELWESSKWKLAYFARPHV